MSINRFSILNTLSFHSILLRTSGGTDQLFLHWDGESFSLCRTSWTPSYFCQRVPFAVHASPEFVQKRLDAAFPDLRMIWPDGSAETLLRLAAELRENANSCHPFAGQLQRPAFFSVQLQDGRILSCQPQRAEEDIHLQLDDGQLLPLDDPAIRDMFINQAYVVIAGRRFRVELVGSGSLLLEHQPNEDHRDIGLVWKDPRDIGPGWEAPVSRVERVYVLRRSIRTDLKALGL